MPIVNANRTLAELLLAIKTEMQLDPGLISDVERTSFLNDCLVDLGGMECFEKQASLVFTLGIATLPVDFVGLIALFRDDIMLKPAKTDRTSTGYITQYPSIEVRPRVTETLTLWYTYAPAPLVNTTDRPDVPYGFDVCMLDYAVARAHRKNGNIGLYREYMSSYNDKKFELYQRLTRLANSRVGMIINNEDADEIEVDDIILL